MPDDENVYFSEAYVLAKMRSELRDGLLLGFMLGVTLTALFGYAIVQLRHICV